MTYREQIERLRQPLSICTVQKMGDLPAVDYVRFIAGVIGGAVIDGHSGVAWHLLSFGPWNSGGQQDEVRFTVGPIRSLKTASEEHSQTRRPRLLFLYALDIAPDQLG